jgi:uncharacterized protein
MRKPRAGKARPNAPAAPRLALGGRARATAGCARPPAWAWRVKLKTSLTLDLMADLREAAEAEAIRVFARNLKDLLLAAPAGGKATMGLDPGIRTGVKVAVVDATGKVLATDTSIRSSRRTTCAARRWRSPG